MMSSDEPRISFSRSLASAAWKHLEERAAWHVWQHMFGPLIVLISCLVESKLAAAGWGA